MFPTTSSPAPSSRRPAASRTPGWFAAAVITTVAGLLLVVVAWWTLHLGPIAVTVPAAAAGLAAVAAARHGRAPLVAFVGGTVATLVSGYLALIAMAEVYAVVVQP